MAVINPAEFRHAFRYEKPSKTANSSSGQGEAYVAVANARGKWEQMSGSSSYDEGRHKMISVYKVTTWWRHALETEVTKDTKLVYDNRVYSIDNIERVGEHRQYYQFTVSAVY